MAIHEEDDTNTTAPDRISNREVNYRFNLIVTLLSLIHNKSFNPVSLFIEYLTNPASQKLINSVCDCNKFQFITKFMTTHKSVAKSRKVTNCIKKLQK